MSDASSIDPLHLGVHLALFVIWNCEFFTTPGIVLTLVLSMQRPYLRDRFVVFVNVPLYQKIFQGFLISTPDPESIPDRWTIS